MSDFNPKINSLNRMIVDIIRSMQNGSRDVTPEIESLFSHIRELRQHYETAALVSRDVEGLDRQIHAKKLEIEEISPQIPSELEKYKAKLSENFDAKVAGNIMFGYTKHGISGLKPSKFNSDIANKLSSPEFKEILDRIEKTSSTITNLNREKHAMENRKMELHSRSRYCKEVIDFIDSFILFCNQSIDNYRDGVVLTNENTRLYQVRIISTDLLYTKKEVYADPFEVFHTIISDDFPEAEIAADKSDQVSSRVVAHEPVLSDILDVFNEDEEYYYGICTGIHVFTRKDNCIKIDEPEKCLLPYFVMTNRFANRLLRGDFSGLREQLHKKCALFLFEHKDCVVFESDSFTISHGHYSDELFGRPPACCAWRHSNYRSFESHSNVLESGLLTLSMENLHSSCDFRRAYGHIDHDMSEMVFRDTSFQSLLCHNFMSLLRSDDKTVNKKIVLQNMKCLFATTAERQIKLYRDIDEVLARPSRFFDHSYVWQHSQGILKLIDIFIPEIRYLLLIRNLLAFRKRNPRYRIPQNYLDGWEMYRSVNKLREDATPEDYLIYLCRVVLLNIITDEQYQQLLTQSSEMSLLLLERIVADSSMYSPIPLIIKQINYIVSNILTRDKKDGGRRIHKIKSKRNHVQNKKSRNNQTKKSRN